MAESILIISSLIYFLIANKTIEWRTLQLLGMPFCVPQMYHTKPQRYEIFCILLLATTVISCSQVTKFPWWIGAIIISFIYIFPFSHGRKNAFRIYRYEMADTLQYEDDPEMREHLITESQKSNLQLLSDIKQKEHFAKLRGSY